MFKAFTVLLLTVFLVSSAPVLKSVVPQTPKPVTILIVKPDTIPYVSAGHDTLKMLKYDSTWITKHYKDSLFFIGADTVSRSSKPVFIKK